MSDTYQQAIGLLEAERAPLAKRIGLIDAAIQGLRELGGSDASARAMRPSVRPSVRPIVGNQRRAERKPSVNGDLDEALSTRLITAIKAGTNTTGALAALVNKVPHTVREELVDLVGKGEIHRTGTGAQNYRWHIGKAAKAAKEAP